MVRRFLLTLAILACSCFAATIRRQRDVPSGYRPWQVHIAYDGQIICGGSILNENNVLTAASCLENDSDQKNGKFTVVAGDSDLSEDDGTEQEREVAKVVIHRRYEGKVFNNIAILQLETPLDMTGSVVMPVTLSNSQFEREAQTLPDGQCFISGWGINGKGKLADLYDTAHPDWAPTLKLDIMTPRKSSKKVMKVLKTDLKRFDRVRERSKTKENYGAARALLQLQDSAALQDEAEEYIPIQDSAEGSTRVSVPFAWWLGISKRDM